MNMHSWKRFDSRQSKRETKYAREGAATCRSIAAPPPRRLSRPEPWLRPADPGVDLTDVGLNGELFAT